MDHCLLCCLLYLTGLIGLAQLLSTKLFEYISKVLGTPPCGNFTAPESAVVIVGGDDGKSSIHTHIWFHGITVIETIGEKTSGEPLL